MQVALEECVVFSNQMPFHSSFSSLIYKEPGKNVWKKLLQ